jgi:curved DNA-binding protein CbpA
VADPYQTLGVSRTASEADIKGRGRVAVAVDLAPVEPGALVLVVQQVIGIGDLAEKDNPKAAEKFSQVTNAYDLLNDKDKRARFDRGEAPPNIPSKISDMSAPSPPKSNCWRKPPAPPGRGPARPRRVPIRPMPCACPSSMPPRSARSGSRWPMARVQADIVAVAGEEGVRHDLDRDDRIARAARALFALAAQGFGGFGGRGRSAAKGANSAYALRVPFVDAAALSPQRITLADGPRRYPTCRHPRRQSRIAGENRPRRRGGARPRRRIPRRRRSSARSPMPMTC